ncbi:MAG: NADH-quinone oxidoreductase subunit J [Anaerolineales bacterium]
MNAQLITFFILAIIAIAAALGMLFSRSAVYSGLFLVLNFGTVAVFYILLNAPFIAMAQVSVYAGAIMVLFLFVIMLLGTELLPPTNALPWQRPLAIFLGLILFAESIYLLFIRKAATGDVPQPIQTFGSPQAVGQALFSSYLLPFEITSVLLLIAMVGAIVLAIREKGK